MEKIAFWDFDKTQGFFDEKSETSEESDREEEPKGFRKGLVKTLKSMKDRGYTHVVTTNNGSYTWVVDLLERKGIDDHLIKRVFAPDAGFDPVTGKDYANVLRYLGIKLEEARRNTVVIGDDASRDMPSREGLLFIHQEEGYKFDAEVIDRILLRLEAESRTSRGIEFETGFRKMYDKTSVYAIGTRCFHLDEQINFAMDFVSRDRLFVPRIYDIWCPSLRADVEKIEIEKPEAKE